MPKRSVKFAVTLHGVEIWSPEEMAFLQTNLRNSLNLMGFAPAGAADIDIELIEAKGEYDAGT